MTKEDLIEKMASDADISKKAAGEALDSFQEAVVNSLKKGDSLTLTGFGTFQASQRAARSGVNPSTGQKIQIPAMTVPKFKPGKKFKDAIK